VASVWIVRPGLVPYAEAFEAQRRIAEARAGGRVPDVLLLLEHPPVYTKGRRTTAAELPMGEEWYRMQGIEVCETDRGGRVTYHGPGQLVGYPIVSLKTRANRAAAGRIPASPGSPLAGARWEEAARVDVVAYVRGLERVVIDSLADHGVDAQAVEGLTGIWVGERKIGSIGVHVSRGVTTHGFAVNVNNDLQPFEWVVPCGLEGCRVTSLTRELGAEQDLDAFSTTVAQRFAEVFEREPVEIEPEDVAARAAGDASLAASAAPVT
jgi:lipoyl(octanoyl) transferase